LFSFHKAKIFVCLFVSVNVILTTLKKQEQSENKLKIVAQTQAGCGFQKVKKRQKTGKKA